MQDPPFKHGLLLQSETDVFQISEVHVHDGVAVTQYYIIITCGTGSISYMLMPRIYAGVQTLSNNNNNNNNNNKRLRVASDLLHIFFHLPKPSQ